MAEIHDLWLIYRSTIEFKSCSMRLSQMAVYLLLCGSKQTLFYCRMTLWVFLCFWVTHPWLNFNSDWLLVLWLFFKSNFKWMFL